ncbi:MAG TPA: cyclase family protein [Candidatus Cybelea sp.]|nr:cyclase family protein [Candidatus Cybelea sp.]
MANARWKHRPDGSNWGDFGADDQLGRMNLLTPEKVRQGAAEIREGIAFCLSLPLDYPGGSKLNPRRSPPVLYPTGPEDAPRYNFPVSRMDAHFTDIVCDDKVLLTLQYSTQWDSLAHVGGMFDADGDGKPEPLYYNGYRAHADVVGPVDYVHGDAKRSEPIGARRLGIENMAVKGVQGRGVLADLHAHFARERKYVGYEDLMRVFERDRVVVETGDMLLLHTGFAQAVLEMRRDPDEKTLHNSCAVLDGRDAKLLRWITDSNIAALIADNYGVEAVPAKPGEGHLHASLPIHEHCLFKLGLHLGELWYLTDLANWLRAHKRNRFMLTAPPLRLPGAVGSPATPIATV